jgi:hypothetical protein
LLLRPFDWVWICSCSYSWLVTGAPSVQSAFGCVYVSEKQKFCGPSSAFCNTNWERRKEGRDLKMSEFDLHLGKRKKKYEFCKRVLICL